VAVAEWLFDQKVIVGNDVGNIMYSSCVCRQIVQMQVSCTKGNRTAWVISTS
jgi:hypothetical protein